MCERVLCLFAQSLPLSILGRAQPNPSAVCRQPTHHIQMAQWPTHTACFLYGDFLLPYKRHFVFMRAASKFQRPVHVSAWWQGHSFSGFYLYIKELHTFKALSLFSTDLYSLLNIVHAHLDIVGLMNDLVAYCWETTGTCLRDLNAS